MKQKENNVEIPLHQLANELDGELFFDEFHTKLFATDASVYRELPLAVAFPKHANDVQQIISFANSHHCSIIPRAAGTSLAGQVVGNGIVVDCSKYFTNIIELNEEEQWVRVQPGVILDELNQYLANFGLFFGPETSTSTHCTVGGMFGNNSCGTHSIIYGSMRDHVLNAEVLLSNGEKVHFGNELRDEFLAQVEGNATNLKQSVYKQLHSLLKNPKTQQLIQDKFPPKEVIRRNTGYALDYLVQSDVFQHNKQPINLCQLLAGSEGTLAFTTELTLNLVPLPPKHKAVVCLHHQSISAACKANIIALTCKPTAVELMDDVIIEMARENPVQKERSKFIVGKPKAVLLTEFMAHTKEDLDHKVQHFLNQKEIEDLIYHHVVLYNNEVNKVWDLRKAGLGVLGNMVGDKKPVALVEDTAVAPDALPEYIAEFEELMQKYKKDCVFYAHISAGELHLRPVLNLKEKEDRALFYNIGKESAELVAKYNGSISGEHGDGRLRGEFIPIQYGQEVMKLFEAVKTIFDPNNIFNPGKIVHTPPMNEFLRYEENQVTKKFDTVYDWSNDLGILRATEKCNGVGLCRKSAAIGGTMCPSFQATKNEKDSTRARANILREVLTNSTAENVFESEDIEDALSLCLSCKACKSECPSSVDMAKLKSEVLQQKYKTKGIPFATKLMIESPYYIEQFHFASKLINAALRTKLAKRILGIAHQRNLPKIQATTLQQWYESRAQSSKNQLVQTVYILNDEFLNVYDVEIGKAAVELLESLNYKVKLLTTISGRTHISKGALVKAKAIAQKNSKQLQAIVEEQAVLVGIEPSTILSFRDEYIDLLEGEEKEQAKKLATICYTVEEFLAKEKKEGRISQNQFEASEQSLLVHGHCQQKALIGNNDLLETLSLLPNTSITEIPSGCCGMAGSFGYEKEHFEVSMKIGELVLFPAIRNAKKEEIIVAPGTSCRHQIKDGVNKRALHPVEVLYQRIKK